MSVTDEKQCHTMPCDQSVLDLTVGEGRPSKLHSCLLLLLRCLRALVEDWFAPDRTNGELMNVSFPVTLKDTAQINFSNS